MEQLRLSGPARPGDVLGGRYRLEELIGEGGMGSVWRASDTALERTAAVKVFWAGAAGDGDAARRESEKKLLASVSHPSLVTLFDAHLSNDELSYLVMEYIDGGTLSSLITRGPVAPRDVASLAADLGEALHVVHEAGIIHRDVKPANILLRPPLTEEHTFRAVLADFGIAYVVDTTRVTAPGMAIGTAAYISPEQVRGHAPTPASDIYSLGLVLLEALSGTRAFSAQTPVEAISVRLTSPPRIPGDWGYGWRSLLTAMTALDPDARPTALEVARRGRDLDTPEHMAEETGPVPLAAADRSVRTKLLIAAAPIGESGAAPVGGVTADEPEVTALFESPADAVPPNRRATREGRGAVSRRRRRGIAIGAIAGSAALVLAAGVWGGVAASNAPTQTPQVEESTDPAPLLSVAPEPTSEPQPEPEPEPATEPVGTDTGTDVSGGGGDVSGGAPPGTGGPANENSGPGNNSGSNGKGNGNGGANGGKGKNG